MKPTDEKESPQEITPISEDSVLRSERHLLYYPFFNISKRDKRKKIYIKETYRRGGQVVEVEWVVKSSEDDLPSPLARRIHRYFIEDIINKMPRPIQNPIQVGSYRSIARALDIDEKNAHKIKRALDQIMETTIKSKGSFCVREQNDDEEHRYWIDHIFHLYDNIVQKGQRLTLPDGRVIEADTNYIFINKVILDSINSGYNVPLDFNVSIGDGGNPSPLGEECVNLSLCDVIS